MASTVMTRTVSSFVLRAAGLAIAVGVLFCLSLGPVLPAFAQGPAPTCSPKIADLWSPGWVLIDEAHEYCPQSGITPSTEHIIRFAKKGRSLGLGLVTTTQQPSALSSRLSSQINMLICHALAFEDDIKAAQARLLNLELDKITIKNKTYETTVTKKILRSLSVGQTLISSTDVNRTFIVAMRPRLAAHGGGHPVHEDDDQNNNE